MSLWTVFKLLAALVCPGGHGLHRHAGLSCRRQAARWGLRENHPQSRRSRRQASPTRTSRKCSIPPNCPTSIPAKRRSRKPTNCSPSAKLAEAREKLTAIVNVFPSSSSAPIARRIVGEMNLDEILSTSHMEGKKIHVVKRGELLPRHRRRIQNHPRLHHAPQRHDGAQKHPARRGTRRHAAGIPPPHRAAAQGALPVGRRPLHPRISHPPPRRIRQAAARRKPRSARNPPNSTATRSPRSPRTTGRRKKSSKSPSPPSRSAVAPRVRDRSFPAASSCCPRTWRKSACSPASATKWRSADQRTAEFSPAFIHSSSSSSIPMFDVHLPISGLASSPRIPNLRPYHAAPRIRKTRRRTRTRTRETPRQVGLPKHRHVRGNLHHGGQTRRNPGRDLQKPNPVAARPDRPPHEPSVHARLRLPRLHGFLRAARRPPHRRRRLHARRIRPHRRQARGRHRPPERPRHQGKPQAQLRQRPSRRLPQGHAPDEDSPRNSACPSSP